MLPVSINTRIKQRPRPTKHVSKLNPTKREKKFLIICPTGYTQNRTQSYRLSEKKTFDTRTLTCSNCGFKKLSKDAKFHGPGFKNAKSFEPIGVANVVIIGKHIQHYLCRKCKCVNSEERLYCIKCNHSMKDRMEKNHEPRS